MNAESKAIKVKRTIGVVTVLLIFIGLCIPLLKFTIGNYLYEKGKFFSLANQYDKALQQLEKAASWQPNDAANQYEVGLTHLRIALKMSPMLQNIMATKAVEHFQLSQKLNPLEPETAYGLARASELLGPENREQTLAAYKRALELWPNNSLYRRAFAQELNRQGKEEELLVTVQTLGEIDPGSYGQLHHESYWSEEIQQAFATGVEEAIAQNIALRQAHMALAAIYEKQGQWKEATGEYQKAMAFKQHSNSEHDYYRLGTLMLHTDQAEAVKFFLQGLALSGTRERDLEQFYHTFRSNTAPEIQLAFYNKAQQGFHLTYRLQILKARTLIDAGKYQDAKDILDQIVLQEQVPEPWYWLARIGELTEDWDTMELAIQRACVLDPNNSSYRMMFSRSLDRQQKYAQAEVQKNLAVRLKDSSEF